MNILNSFLFEMFIFYIKNDSFVQFLLPKKFRFGKLGSKLGSFWEVKFLYFSGIEPLFLIRIIDLFCFA